MRPLAHSIRLALPASLLLLAACSTTPTDDVRSIDLEGTWKGSVTSPTAPACDRIIIMEFDQEGESFTGTFFLLDDASGTFEGTISNGELSGEVTSRYDSCTGTGNFTGTVTDDLIQIHAPIITTFDEGCEFCQDNELVLTPE